MSDNQPDNQLDIQSDNQSDNQLDIQSDNQLDGQGCDLSSLLKSNFLL
jgi:hypothetical protein